MIDEYPKPRDQNGWYWESCGVGNHMTANGHIDMIVNCPYIPYDTYNDPSWGRHPKVQPIPYHTKLLVQDADDCADEIITILRKNGFEIFLKQIDITEQLNIKTKIIEKVYEYLKLWAK